MQVVVATKDMVAIETEMLTSDEALTVPDEINAAYIWTREDGTDSATLQKM